MMFQITSLTAFQILLFCCIVIGKYNDPSKVKVAQIFFAFVCNAKSFAIAVIFLFLFFSATNLDGWMKVDCGRGGSIQTH